LIKFPVMTAGQVMKNGWRNFKNFMNRKGACFVQIVVNWGGMINLFDRLVESTQREGEFVGKSGWSYKAITYQLLIINGILEVRVRDNYLD
jgi:hypothetical protein